jgi:arylsulfatase A-like enzyme
MAPKSGEKKMKLSFFKSVGMTRKFMRYVGISSCSVILTLLLTVPAPGAEPNDGSVLPFPPSPMAGVARPRLQDSIMKWPEIPQRLPKDAPNILIVMLDDVGFGVAETFGGEVHTPTLSKLAEEGLRYNAFHTTSICSPTRAALLTGRNHTRVDSGTIAERAVAFDGYTGVIPNTAATIAEVLKEYGYHTSAFGKWHNTPAIETTAMGPKDRWPTGYGFEYFYGFLGGETSQWEPRLTENTNHIEPPEHDPKYHLTQDMVDKALEWLDDYRAFSPDKPFFMYWAPGGVHGPHHIFSEWADKYKGKFDDGWDAYRERAYKRQLEMGVIPPDTKLLGAYFGGTRNPMVISWPKRIKPDKRMRSQFHHVVDIAPTIYEVLHIPHPKVVNGYEQLPMDGTSLAYTFDGPTADTRKNTQFFDNNGSRAIYQDGWMACTFGPFIPWDTPGSVKRIANWDSAKDQWELYDLRQDFSQAVDLAAKYPDKLEEMKKSFLALAADNKAFPIGAGNWLRLHPEDRIKTPYTTWHFNQNTRRMPEFAAPGVGRESTHVTIDAEIGEKASGVLYAVGGSGGGLTLYMDQGQLVYEYNMMIIEQYTARSATPLAAGKHTIEVVTDIEGPGQAGTVRLVVDGTEVGTTELKRTVPAAFTATETFDVGMDLGSTVSLGYFDRRPFKFSGKINDVTVSLK